ncbi:Hypothetical protein CKL_0611 [Clostridium kluyveri DSM 555]|uniref:Uncharacterized protein n=1 Tax=Clostridium kluyveri (strain ATCC 8527 / DSM 555 / NBRC 12016 / NCIMB 10680 / K1) TaxID=431943 RepID=A5N5T4_CLOK5|nr:Hypothetical protein CKL_0611 [Clostridium kluyveri DSM 555]
MSFLSRSSKKRKYANNHQGSRYYKREGFFSRIFRMFGSYSNSHRRYKKYYSYSPDERYHYDERRYPPREYRRKRHKSSWS